MKRIVTVLLVMLAMVVSSASADAARKKKAKRKKPTPAAVAPKDPDMKVKESAGGTPGKKGKKVRVYDFGAIGIEGSMRTPALLYFLGRAREELDRASLEKRSFMPELVRSVDEGSL